MINLAIIVSIFFWVPAGFVVTYYLLHSLKFIQTREFSLRRLYQALLWDYSPQNRPKWSLTLKLALFVGCLLFIVRPSNPITTVCLALAYIVWCIEMFLIAEKIILKKVEWPVFDLRLMTSLGAALVLLSILPILLTYFVGQSTPLSNSISSFADSLTAILPHQIDDFGGNIIPLPYIFIVFSTALGLAYDLSATAIAVLVAILTKPFTWLYLQLLLIRTKTKLQLHPQLITIAVTGSSGKSTTIKLLEALLKDEFKVAVASSIQTNIYAIANTVINEVTPDTQILIVELHPYFPGDMTKICKILKPKFGVITNIDESHIGLSGSLEETLALKAEMLSFMHQNSVLVTNGDDPLFDDLVSQGDLSEVIIFGQKHNRIQGVNLGDHLNYYHATDINHHNDKLDFVLVNHSGSMPVEVAHMQKLSMYPLLASIAVAHRLGISLEKVVQKLAQINIPNWSRQVIAGDNGSTLLLDTTAENFTSFNSALDYVSKMNSEHKILITTGIPELGKFKTDVYHELSSSINTQFDVVITSDSRFAKAIKRHNQKSMIIVSKSWDDIIYSVRKTMRPGTLALILGKVDTGVIRDLASEFS